MAPFDLPRSVGKGDWRPCRGTPTRQAGTETLARRLTPPTPPRALGDRSRRASGRGGRGYSTYVSSGEEAAGPIEGLGSSPRPCGVLAGVTSAGLPSKFSGRGGPPSLITSTSFWTPGTMGLPPLKPQPTSTPTQPPT